MMNHPYDRSPGLTNPDLEVGKVWFGDRRPDIMQPNRYPFGTHHRPIPTREEIEKLLSTLLIPVVSDATEDALNEQPEEDVCEGCATDDGYDDPSIFLTLDQALFVHELLQAAFMGAGFELEESASQMITLGLTHLRGKIDEVQSALETQLTAAEAF